MEVLAFSKLVFLQIWEGKMVFISFSKLLSKYLTQVLKGFLDGHLLSITFPCVTSPLSGSLSYQLPN